MSKRGIPAQKTQVDRSDKPEAGRVDAPLPYVDGAAPETLDPRHRAVVSRGLNQIRRNEFATDGDVEAVFRRFGP